MLTLSKKRASQVVCWWELRGCCGCVWLVCFRTHMPINRCRNYKVPEIHHSDFFGFLGLISAYCLSLCHKTTSALLGLSLYIVGTLAILAVGVMSARSANGHGPGSTWRFSWDYQMFHMSPYRCNERMYSGVDSSLSISARVLVFSEAPYSVIDSYFTYIYTYIHTYH